MIYESVCIEVFELHQLVWIYVVTKLIRVLLFIWLRLSISGLHIYRIYISFGLNLVLYQYEIGFFMFDPERHRRETEIEKFNEQLSLFVYFVVLIVYI